MANTFGHLFRVTTWGESHGPAIGAVVDGCPPRLPLAEDDIQPELDRRAPGQSRITTQRKEADAVKLLSGVFEGLTLGTPIALHIANGDARSDDYREMRVKYRPSHADYTYDAKYGTRDFRGGGRTSARETAGRVAAGAIARKLLAHTNGVEIVAWVSKVGRLAMGTVVSDLETVTRDDVDQTIIRCPDLSVAERMIAAVEAARKDGNSLGGTITCAVRGCPPGWGEPVFDRLEADLAKAMLSLPASKGFEIGSGFAGTDLTGLEHNDPFHMEGDRVRTVTNRSGGVQGGITNGETVYFRVAFKPTATVMRSQRTVNVWHEDDELQGRGRHDPCVLPRAVPIVEAMAALVLADHALRHAALMATAGPTVPLPPRAEAPAPSRSGPG
ncbi:MAG TPA: chorismate synthase [Chloroflexota bacterium]|nr:chorismate synthase [Chloroflexota bacterium]